MVVELVRVKRCDVCGSDLEVRRWRIAPEGGKAKSVDLCAHHGSPVEAVLVNAPTDRRRTKREVLTPEEIAKRKRTAKKTTKK